jgi:hypothetical protein
VPILLTISRGKPCVYIYKNKDGNPSKNEKMKKKNLKNRQENA